MAKRNRLSVNNRLAYCCTFLLCLVTISVAQAQNPVPLINEPLVPDALKPGSAGFTLTVNGTGFVSSSVVMWNGNARPTTFVSSSRINATILSSDVAKSGAASVTVSNPGPGGGASNVIFFDVSPPTFPVELKRKDYETGSGSQPNSVGVGDFNGDGKLDLAVASFTTDTATIFLGNGDGTFQPGVNYAVQSVPDSVIVRDFNGDGKLDVVVRNNGSNSVSILLGNGDGTFQAAHNFATGNSPNFQAAGDFNGDGKLDLAVANGGDNTVSILLGNGDGTFQPRVDYPCGPYPAGVAAGDFNRDGKLDLVVTNYLGANTVSILLGNGDGTFQSPVPYATGATPVFVAAGDFNQDGKLDLAVTNGSDSTVSVLLGNGDGTFQTRVDYAVGASPWMVATADIDADGKLDLAVANWGGVAVSVLKGNGDGTFQSANNFGAGNGPLWVAFADFNGDGRIDLAVPKYSDAAVAILLQDGSITLSPSSLKFAGHVLGTTSAPKSVTLTNVGAATLTISGIAIGGTNAPDFAESNTCGSSLAPKAQCTISVTFTPSQLESRTASITITDNGLGNPHTVPISGFGVMSGPNATLSAISLTFIPQLVGTSSPAQSVTLSNYGTAALNMAGIVASGDFDTATTCGSSLAVLATCTISVTFKPTQPGTRTETLSIADNAPGSPQTVSLSGTGTVVKLNPTSLGFGVHKVGTSATQSATLTNVGSTALSITSISIAGKDADEFHQTNTCGSTVAAGGSCSISVTFKPSERGTDSANVSITDNGGGSPQSVPLSGAGCTIVNRKCKVVAINRLTVKSALTARQNVAVPAPTGSHRVGTRILDLVDSTRIDPFLHNGNRRELLVRFWYPTSPDFVCEPAEYTSPRVWGYFAELTGLRLPQVGTNSCLNAPMADNAHPIVVFTHGYTGTFTDYTFLFEDLASRGFVVVSIDHTYEATAVEFPNGRLAESLIGSHLNDTWRTDDKIVSFVLSVRAKDLAFVVDELERLNTTAGDPFAGKLETSRIALMGHSLGGQATLSGLQQDPRFKAGVIVDGALNDNSIDRIDRPVLILGAGRDEWSAGECRLWDSLTGPRVAVNLRGAEHLTPSDAVWLAKGVIKTGDMGPEKTLAAIRTYIAAFLEANLEGRQPDLILRGPTPNYRDVSITPRELPLCEGTQASSRH